MHLANTQKKYYKCYITILSKQIISKGDGQYMMFLFQLPWSCHSCPVPSDGPVMVY